MGLSQERRAQRRGGTRDAHALSQRGQETRVVDDPAKSLQDFLSAKEAEALIYEAEHAEAWVVLTICLQFGTMSFDGPYIDPIEAMAFASRQQEELDECLEPDEPGWKVSVHPMSRGG